MGVEVGALHVRLVHDCAYNDCPEPKLQVVSKWLTTWRGIKTLNARCKCKEPHRSVGRKHDGTWSSNLKYLQEGCPYPERLSEALLAAWAQDSSVIGKLMARQTACGCTWEWVDPRTGVEHSEAPARKMARTTARSRVVQSSELSFWGSIQPNIVESGSQGVQNVGPWSATFPTTASSISSSSSFSPWELVPENTDEHRPPSPT